MGTLDFKPPEPVDVGGQPLTESPGRFVIWLLPFAGGKLIDYPNVGLIELLCVDARPFMSR